MQKLLCFLVAVMFLAGCCLAAQDLQVTDVDGESWISHLARDFDETSMGKTGRLGPAPGVPSDDSPRGKSGTALVLGPGTVVLHGSDLYRLNCQGCHGESGLGAPPEINSLINPVRATSVALIVERMKKVGMDTSPANAAEMAQQSRAALLLRLHEGGQDMPSFHHLSEPEIHALLGYLKQLAGVPGAESERATLQESHIRVGEHIAKSTCHICHAAAGSNPSPQELMEGAIPPLNTLTARVSLPEFVRKVTEGAPVLMGIPPLLCRGRMPVFGYLTQDEAQDVYLYLTLHPPPTSATAMALVSSGGPSSPGGRLPVTNSFSSSAVSAVSEGDVPSVSLVRLAFYPAVLFVFLGSVVVTCLPMAAKAHHQNEICRVPSGTPVEHHSATVAAGIGIQAPFVRSDGTSTGEINYCALSTTVTEGCDEHHC